ncbi:MAG: signal peptidase II [Alphaproteobacteria bacterium]|nr:signal peptidase II [Alphaproteobacteria bacterium]
MKPRIGKWAGIVAGLAFLDLFTKQLAVAAAAGFWTLGGNFATLFPTYTHIATVAPFFNLVLVFNEGISFSMFNFGGAAARWTLTILAATITGFVIREMLREKDITHKYAWAIIAAGAIGNIVDRIRFGAVVDFLDFHAFGHHWPAFNIADALICVGVGILVFVKKKKIR